MHFSIIVYISIIKFTINIIHTKMSHLKINIHNIYTFFYYFLTYIYTIILIELLLNLK